MGGCRAFLSLWVLVAGSVGCASAPSSSGAAASGGANGSDIPAGELAVAIEELRFRIASRPRDVAAHLELARLEQAAGRPGAAIRHFEIARRNDALLPDDRVTLHRLLIARFRTRLARGDGDAHRDLETAAGLIGDRAAGPGFGPGTQLVREAHFLAVLSELRRGNRWGDREAGDHLAAAGEVAPGDPRLVAMTPGQAPLESLAVAAMWLHRGGARRAARQALESYVGRGGREPGVLRAWVAARAWWGEERLGFELRRDLATAGVSACPFSWGREDGDAPPAGAPGCAGTLWSVATGDLAYAELVVERAVAESWSVQDPSEAAAWSLIALRRWLAGVGEYHAGALDPAPATTPGLESGQRLLVAAESALAGGSPAAVGEILAAVSDPALVSDAWVLRLLVAVPGSADVAGILSSAPGPAVRRRLVRRLPASVVIPPRDGSDPSVAASAPDVVSREEVIALAEVAEGYFLDPAVADRRAGDFVDGVPYIGQRGPMVAALFLALGDPDRARLWWQRIVALSPRHPDHVYEFAAALAAAGDGEAAAVRFVAAAALSGDPGHTSLRAARELLATGHGVLALSAGRRALSITAPVRRAPVYRVLARAMTELGRDDEAAEMLARSRPARRREPASASPEGALDGPGPVRNPRWYPDDEWLHQQLAERAAPGSREREAAMATLLALALEPSLERVEDGETVVVPGELPAVRARRWDRARRAARALQSVSSRDSHRTLRRIVAGIHAGWSRARGGGGPGARSR